MKTLGFILFVLFLIGFVTLKEEQWLREDTDTGLGKFHIKTIVIDAGHGGESTGAIRNNIQEKDINLDVALKLQKKLQRLPSLEVIMTRTQDVTVPLSERIDYRADLYLSIHHNATPSNNGAGYEVYHSNNEYTTDIANTIAAKFEPFQEKRYVGVKAMGGSSQGEYFLVRRHQASILTEFCFVQDITITLIDSEVNALYEAIVDYI